MMRFSKRVRSVLGLFFLFLSILILLSTGCTSRHQNINEKENLKTNDAEITKGDLFIDSDLDFYSPIMSIVPGLPLKGRFESDNIIQNVRYHWIAEYGIILSDSNLPFKGKPGTIDIIGL